MSDLRKSTGSARLSLKAAVRRAIALAGGGRSVEHATRVSHSVLSRYGSPSYPEHQCALDVALDLDLEAGQPIILAALAEAEQHKIEPLRVSADVDDMPWCSEVAKIATMAGAVQSEIATALIDERFDAREEACIVEKIDDAIASLRATKARIRAERSER